MIDVGRRTVKFYLTRNYETVSEDPIWEVLLEDGEGLTAEVVQAPEEPKKRPNPDALIAWWIRRKFNGEGFDVGSSAQHLQECNFSALLHPEGTDGTYGCDTGCEYVRLTATFSCPHGEEYEYEYGTFGELSWILEDIEDEWEAEYGG